MSWRQKFDDIDDGKVYEPMMMYINVAEEFAVQVRFGCPDISGLPPLEWPNTAFWEQGTLTKGEGSVQLTSMYLLV
jgi:hypothetical protein